MHFGRINMVSGELLGWYSSKQIKQKNIIDQCIAVDDKDWQYALNIGATHYINGKFIRREKELSYEEKLEVLRRKRDKALTEVDIYQGVLRYEELTSSQKEDLRVYRRALLDAPQDMVLPNKPIWMK